MVPRIYDYIIVGGGIGGVSIGAHLGNQGKSVCLLEKEPYLGGCSSTFSHKGFRYNTGATTFAGWGEGMIVREFFQSLAIAPELIPLKNAFTQINNTLNLPHHEDLNTFVQALETNFSHPKNRSFWENIYNLNRQFYRHNSYIYTKRTLGELIRSMGTFLPIAKAFWPLILQRADRYIQRHLPNISPQYYQALEAQLRIVAQASMRESSALGLILALGYPFLGNAYVKGGMGKLFDALESKIDSIHKATSVLHIDSKEAYYTAHTHKGGFFGRNLILNLPLFDSGRFFDPGPIRKYFNKFKTLDNNQSAFMLYGTLKCNKPLEHHYQILLPKALKNTISDALFVSFSDINDTQMAPSGHFSMTLSVHTKSSWWLELDKLTYTIQKQALVSQLLEIVCDTLGVQKEDFVSYFGATPKTFKHYIGRAGLGGIPMHYTRPFFKNPANDTPFRGLYCVGDTTFAAQGWPGVIAGVRNLSRILDATN
jgi:phytoene dehydrogenase-like protein